MAMLHDGHFEEGEGWSGCEHDTRKGGCRNALGTRGLMSSMRWTKRNGGGGDSPTTTQAIARQTWTSAFSCSRPRLQQVIRLARNLCQDQTSQRRAQQCSTTSNNQSSHRLKVNTNRKKTSRKQNKLFLKEISLSRQSNAF